MSYPRDKKYLEYIRTLPCVVQGCHSMPRAHHVETGGTAIKGSDYSCVPVCDHHHTVGTNALHRIGHRNFEKKHGVSFAMAIATYLHVFFAESPIRFPNDLVRASLDP